MNTAEFLSIANLISPEKEAVIFEDKRFTYNQLNSRANQLANKLTSWGVGAGDRVGLMQVNLSLIHI